MIEKLKELEQEAMDNLDPETYDAIVSNVLSQEDQEVYQSGYNLWISDLDGSTPKQLTDLSYLSKPYVEISKNEGA